MIDPMQQARELLAAESEEYAKWGILNLPIEELRYDLQAALRAIAAALRAAPEGLIEQHARDSQELRRLCQSRDFYKLRCEALQAAQSNMRDPERKAVCDILANGSTSALASRPQGVKDAR